MERWVHGKTIDLLKVAYNYEERGQSVILYSAAIDNRYEKSTITTRIGISRPCRTFSKETNIFLDIVQHNYKPDCVLVDEAQFLSKAQVKELTDVVDFLNIPVICYGLKTDFRQEFFEGSEMLMKMADKIEEIKTICDCGQKATINMRFIDGKPVIDGNQIVIGGNDSYKSVCRKCFRKYIGKIEKRGSQD